MSKKRSRATRHPSPSRPERRAPIPCESRACAEAYLRSRLSAFQVDTLLGLAGRIAADEPTRPQRRRSSFERFAAAVRALAPLAAEWDPRLREHLEPWLRVLEESGAPTRRAPGRPALPGDEGRFAKWILRASAQLGVVSVPLKARGLLAVAVLARMERCRRDPDEQAKALNRWEKLYAKYRPADPVALADEFRRKAMDAARHEQEKGRRAELEAIRRACDAIARDARRQWPELDV